MFFVVQNDLEISAHQRAHAPVDRPTTLRGNKRLRQYYNKHVLRAVNESSPYLHFFFISFIIRLSAKFETSACKQRVYFRNAYLLLPPPPTRDNTTCTMKNRFSLFFVHTSVMAVSAKAACRKQIDRNRKT